MEILIRLILVMVVLVSSVNADIKDPFDSFDFSSSLFDNNTPDNQKSIETLLIEASTIMENNPLDARTKLLIAIRKDKENIPALLLLSQYYTRHVGHYRLALKYLKKAEDILYKKHGKPPYYSRIKQLTHSDILRQLSIVRQNLDNYQGALNTLNEYEISGYMDVYFYSSKAWILFKLNRIEDAIKIAKKGLKTNSNLGGTLNVLGILLSVNGQREEAIKVLTQAYEYEKMFGASGQPATPLNNIGEVYRETFNEQSAINSWQKAVSLPDGCEHILPSLNLAVISMESLKFDLAENAINDFLSCVAQFPLKNGEEHKALVLLAKGRIAMHRGNIDKAIENFEQAIQRQQWFGKIGTNIEDLQSALYSSMAYALTRKNNHISSTIHKNFTDYADAKYSILKNKLKAFWYNRKAKTLLTEKLNDFEDAYIRRTDSIIEYATLGETIKSIPASTAKRLLIKLDKTDHRNRTDLYYKAYLAENYINNFNKTKGLSMLREVIQDKRSEYDLALVNHAKCKLLEYTDLDSKSYNDIAQSVYNIAPALIRNYGLKLPVNYSEPTKAVLRKLNKSSLYLNNNQNLSYQINYSSSGNTHNFVLLSKKSNVVIAKAEDANLNDAINKFINNIFSE